MTASATTRFDPDALLSLAGAKVHARGMAYADQGQVSLLSVGPDRVVAEVYGSERYSVMITGRARRIGGNCDCPAFEDSGFCKHVVAVALTANAALAAGMDCDTLCEDVEAHLAAMPKEGLVSYVMGIALRNTALLRTLAYDAELDLRDDLASAVILWPPPSRGSPRRSPRRTTVRRWRPRPDRRGP
jgi:hypothetical protein